MAGGLSVEVDEDVQMVENAAAPALFSPGMWVQRPQRTPAMAPRDAEPADQRGTAAPPARGPDGLGSSLADPDLAYLNIGDERDSAEKEYMKQDSEHMEALEQAYGRLREQNRAMEQQLKGVVAAVNEVMDENRTIKGLLAMLQVQRDDFVFNPQQTIAAQQEAIGLRLLHNLEGSPPGAQPPAQQLQQQGGAAAPQQRHQHQQEQQQGGLTGSQQQQQQQQQEEAQHVGGAVLAGPALLEMSPGCMLPLSTPGSLLRTVSPKIGALRFDSLATAGDLGTAGQAPPTVVPASPYDFPAESQIAAAALTAKQGDTAAALLTLLDKAIEARMERQQAAQQAAQQAQAAQNQGSQQQQEQRVYRM